MVADGLSKKSQVGKNGPGAPKHQKVIQDYDLIVIPDALWDAAIYPEPQPPGPD